MNLDHSSTLAKRLLLALYFAGLLAGCSDPETTQSVIDGRTMGTTYQVKVIDAVVDEAQLKRDIDQRLEAVNAVFSTYIPDSEISQLNQRTDDTPVAVSDDMLELLTLSQQIHALTGGAFDVTVGPLVNLWGFGPDGPRNGVPDQAEIDELLAHTGFDLVDLTGGVLSAPTYLTIDMSAIAKGYGVDEIGALLEAKGFGRYMVEIGGEVRTRGANAAGEAWRIGVETPDRAMRRLHEVLPLEDLGMATSGDYRNFFSYGGRHYSHTLNPQTGWPVDHDMASVTVLHPSTAYADAIATAFSVIGPERTMEIAQAQNLLVFAILRQNEGYREQLSPALVSYLENTSGSKSN